MKLKDILLSELHEISLSSKEVIELTKLADFVVTKLKKVGLKATIGGSLAKGTAIKKEKQDIDIFVSFESESQMSTFRNSIKKADLGGKLKIVHGSRDYFQIDYKTAIIELIPTVKVSTPEQAKNVTDVSLFHVDYVTNKIKENPSLADEIRLLKAFCQANGFYGAEGYVRGFSGYSLEVLIIHFGSFVNFLKKIGKNKVIDPEKLFRNEKEVLFELNSSKLQGPLIVVDPTYKYRNVTAGLGKETFDKFLDVARNFLKKPSTDFFSYKKIDVKLLKDLSIKNKAILLKIELATNRQIGDIAGTKCLKFLDFFSKELKRNGQQPIHREFSYDGGQTAIGYLVIKTKTPVEFRGPPLSMKEASHFFQNENKDAYEKKSHLWVLKDIDIQKIFSDANKVKNEMGAWGEKLEVIFNGEKKTK